MNNKFQFRFVLILMLSLAMTGCARKTLDPVADEQPLKAKRWQVVLQVEEGTELGLTVWQPELQPGETAPLMLHTHGFGLQRMDGKFGLYENFLFTGQVAKNMWKKGYWLITWDQRGHGDSGDKINLMEPDKEVADVSRIIDWALENISRISNENGDPLVGMIGESYGGAVQMLASVKDPRIDAVVPLTTWYDLDYALAPADVPKGGWMRVLYMMGDWVNFRKFPENLREAFDYAKKGEIPNETREYLADNQMKYYCDSNQYPHANALIISGLRDVLFNPHQGLQAQQCFKNAGKQASLIINRDGHLLPSKQMSNELPGWALDNNLFCGAEKISTEDYVVAWLEQELPLTNGHSESASSLALFESGSICLSLDGWGESFQQWPDNKVQIALTGVELSGNGAGRWEGFNWMSDTVSGIRTKNALAKKFESAKDGSWRPAFWPLHTASANEKIIGTPSIQVQAQAKLNAEVEGVEHVALSALVLRRAGSARLKLVHQQVAPIKFGRVENLPPIAVALEEGDQLGLVLFSRHGQFNTLDMDFGEGMQISGDFWLPASLDADPAELAVQ